MRTFFRFSSISIAALAIGALSSVASDARAQGDAMTDASRALFTEAVAAMNAQDWAGCRLKALGALGGKQHPQILSLLGLCEEKANLPRDAAEHLHQAIAGGEGDHPDRGADVRAAYERARKLIGTIEINASQPGAEVKVDGKAIGKAPATAFVEPGPHKLEALLTGHDGPPVELTMAAGRTERITILLSKAQGGGAGGAGEGGGDVGPLEPDEPSAPKPVWPIIALGGTAAVGLGLGVVLTVVGVGQTSDVDGVACPGDASTCPASVTDAVGSRNGLLGASIPAYAVGGLAAAGLITYLVWPSGSSASDAAWLEPAPAPGDVGLGLRARF